ncbi:MAG: hypothetical protein QOF32_1359 [Gammaproteobacteria bacterium]|nr:hypothetical protein [Gammaproteobacteria bacterium]
MNPPVARRLLCMACARLLAVLMSWSADVSWRGTACLRGRFIEGTVKTNVKSLPKKLDVLGRIAAASEAVHRGLVQRA